MQAVVLIIGAYMISHQMTSSFSLANALSLQPAIGAVEWVIYIDGYFWWISNLECIITQSTPTQFGLFLNPASSTTATASLSISLSSDSSIHPSVFFIQVKVKPVLAVRIRAEFYSVDHFHHRLLYACCGCCLTLRVSHFPPDFWSSINQSINQSITVPLDMTFPRCSWALWFLPRLGSATAFFCRSVEGFLLRYSITYWSLSVPL